MPDLDESSAVGVYRALAGACQEALTECLIKRYQLRAALEALHATQNGPPLDKYSDRWEQAMRLTRTALGLDQEEA